MVKDGEALHGLQTPLQTMNVLEIFWLKYSRCTSYDVGIQPSLDDLQ